MRSVGAVADGRRQTLRAVLDLQHARLTQFLTSVAIPTCAGDAQGACLRRELEDFARSEGATAAILRRGTQTVSVGEPAHWVEAATTGQPPAAMMAIGPSGRRRESVRARLGDASIALRLRPDRIDELFLDRRGLGQSGETFLIDSHGAFLTPPRYTAPFAPSHPTHPEPMMRCLAGSDGEMRAPDYRGVDVIHGFRSVPELGGACIMAHLESREVLAGARALRWHLAAAIGVLALLTVAASKLLAATVASPIAKLAAATERLRRGRLDCSDVEACSVAIAGPPEIRAFADSFSSMARAVTESHCALEQAVRARQDLLAVVSHDLQNPLHCITLQTSALRRVAQTSAPDLEPKLDRIGRAAERMRRLIADLLDAASIEHGTLSVDLRPCDSEVMLSETIGLLRPAASEHGVVLALEPPVAAPLPVVRCDEHRISQVLGNLVCNAIKFTPAGGAVSLRARVAGERLELSVTDEGPGIPPEAVEQLFAPYWHTARKEGGGTGLGLYIGKGIVEAHRGTLRVESAPGNGSRFFFELPVAERELPSVDAATVPQQAPEAHSVARRA